MGQAKSRGNREERIAQAKASRKPPEKGLYISTREVKGMRFIVEEVSIESDDEEGEIFYVSLIDESSSEDLTAAGDELISDEWFALVEQYGLVLSKK